MASMELTKLTTEERKAWEAMCAQGYEESPLRDSMDEESFALICLICRAALEGDFSCLHGLIAENCVTCARNEDNPAFCNLLKRAYEHGVVCGDAGCCCNLANMYHDTKNEGSDEDYAKAVALYELGADRGDVQSSVNLGYIYYYGRGTDEDYVRAYECFARAALLEDHPEALWKLGDLYAAGKGVPQSDRMAWELYSKAYEKTDGSALRCRAAHHMADYLLKGIDGFLDPDPERALALYTEAELYYYAVIDAGLSYYSRQLDQAIEGQSAAREAVRERHRRIREGE